MTNELFWDDAEADQLIRQIAEKLVKDKTTANDFFGNRIAYTEQEAADLLGMTKRQLMDTRSVRGKLKASTLGRTVTRSTN